MAGKKWSEREDKILVKNYSKLNNKTLVTLLPNRSRNSIVLRASKFKLKKNLSTYYRCGKLENLLEETNEAYYWIGFLLADGYIDFKSERLTLHLSEKDKKSIEAISNFLEIKNNNKNYISIQDKQNIPKIIKKFNFKARKTYNPPTKKFKFDSKLISLYCGFIDGDGCIQHQYKRSDSKITIKVHKSWFNFLCDMEENLYKYFKVSKFNNRRKTKINNCGYSLLCLSDNSLLKKLKLFCLNNNLPAIKRKWDIIDETKISKYEKARQNKTKINNLLKSGHTIKEISSILKIKYSTVYASIKRKGGSYV